jgi:hypothetical protein
VLSISQPPLTRYHFLIQQQRENPEVRPASFQEERTG